MYMFSIFRCYDERVKSHYAFPYFCEKQYPKGIHAKCCTSELCNEEDILPPIESDPTVIESTIIIYSSRPNFKLNLCLQSLQLHHQ